MRADDGTRTRDIHLGKVVRYQLRYVRTLNEERMKFDPAFLLGEIYRRFASAPK